MRYRSQTKAFVLDLTVDAVGNRRNTGRLGVIVDVVFLDCEFHQSTRTADTAAVAGHAFYEVALQEVSRLLEHRHTAHLDAVAGLRLKFDVGTKFLQTLGHCFGKTAGSCEDSAEVRSLIDRCFFEIF